MMKSKLLSKIADRKFEKMGFIKEKETEFGVTYRRPYKIYGYTQIVEINHRNEIPNMMHSYEEETNSDGLSNVVGVSAAIMRASLLKMFAMGFNDDKKKKHTDLNFDL